MRMQCYLVLFYTFHLLLRYAIHNGLKRTKIVKVNSISLHVDIRNCRKERSKFLVQELIMITEMYGKLINCLACVE